MEYPSIAQNCRACQDKTREDSRILIFASIKLPDIFKETTSLDIQKNDGLPEVLCLTCYNRLLEAYNFRKMCSASALDFHQILSANNQEDTVSENVKDPIVIPNADINEISDSASEKSYSHPDSIMEILDDDPAVPEETEKTEKTQKLKKFNVECNLCNLIFFRKEGLEIHMMVKHQGLESCQCLICGTSFDSKDSLIMHLEVHHGVIEDKYERKQEHKQERKQQERKQSVSGKNDWVCNDCGIQFQNYYTINKHTCRPNITSLLRPSKIQEETEKRDKPWVCEFCPYETSSRVSMYRHLKEIHQGIKKFQCHYCDRCFGNSWNLKHHVMIHTGEKPHACEICGKRFIQPVSLKTHMKMHPEVLK
uniref:Uncharacterized protein n=1 Tax=Phlebotomus papatasi TaxID=29031 RepID=A0A1B0EZ55_PHLPP